MTAPLEQQIVDAYTTTAFGADVISKQFGVGKSTVYRILRKNNIATDPKKQSHAWKTKFTVQDEDRIEELYKTGLRAPEIAEKMDCFPSTVRKLLKSRGIVLRKGAQRKRIADHTVAEIISRYAAGESQEALSNSLHMHQTTISRVLREHGLHIGKCGNEHPRWGGGRVKYGEGYVGVWVDPAGPYASMRGSTGYVMEHRLVMAQHLGRPLLPTETVHHRDGNKQNNALENLQLRQGKHGRGIEMQCRSCGSNDVGAV